MKVVRELLFNCKEGNKSDIKSFINKVEAMESKDDLSIAYIAIAKAYKAKIALNPLKKIEFLKSFKEEINTVILNKKSLEIIFLRFLIQSNIPIGLGFSDNLNQDYHFINANIEDIDKEGFDDDFKAYIKKVMELNTPR